MQPNFLRELLAQLVGLAASGGFGVVSSKVMAFLKERYPFVANLDYTSKRAMAYAIAIVASILPFLFTTLMLYETPPWGWRGWIEALAPFVVAAITGNQGAHAVSKTKKR